MQSQNSIQSKQVITVEGNVINIDGYDIGKYIEVPLKEIKEYKWCDILERIVPVHFREVFERKDYYFIKDYEAYENEDYTTFTIWVSKEIK